jgi:hypothetical protein
MIASGESRLCREHRAADKEVEVTDSYIHSLSPDTAFCLEHETGRKLLYYLEGAVHPVGYDVLLAIGLCFCTDATQDSIDGELRHLEDEGAIICDFYSDPDGVELFELTTLGSQ